MTTTDIIVTILVAAAVLAGLYGVYLFIRRDKRKPRTR